MEAYKKDGGKTQWSGSHSNHFTPWRKSPQYLLDRRLDGKASKARLNKVVKIKISAAT
jgi:hypothetical protein